MTALQLIAGVFLAIAAGFPIVRSAPLSFAGRIALAFTAGAAMQTMFLMAAGIAGFEMTGLTITAASLLLASISLFVFRGEPREGIRKTFTPIEVTWISAFSIVAIKVLRVPVWSWDHFGIWGTKARRLFIDDRLDLATLSLGGMPSQNPDYPIGFPLLVHDLLAGARPDELQFKLIHLLFAFVLLLIVREWCLQSECSPAVTSVTLTYVAVQPLFWDTESMGLADLPLVAFALAGFVLSGQAREGRASSIAAGVMIGFLPWLKNEGITLAILLAIGALVMSNVRRRHFTAAAVASYGSAIFFAKAFLPPGTSFFAGEPMARALTRLHDPWAIIGPCVRELLRPEFAGVWILFLLTACAKRSSRVVVLQLTVTLQLLIYVAVYFLTYLEPGAHIASSFHRIMAAMAPLGIAAVAASLRQFESGEAPNPAEGVSSASISEGSGGGSRLRCVAAAKAVKQWLPLGAFFAG